MKNRKLTTLFASLLFAYGMNAYSSDVIDRENIAFFLADTSEIYCTPPTEGDGGFRNPEPGKISLNPNLMTDSAGRFGELWWLSTDIPDSFTCDDFYAQAHLIPQTLVAEKIIERERYGSHDIPGGIGSRLTTSFRVRLPIMVDGDELVLTTSNREWIEEVPYSGASMPISSLYFTRIFPQAAEPSVGLACTALEGGYRYRLTVGNLSNTDYFKQSNVDKGAATFFSQEECDAERDRLMNKFKSEDPQNYGSIVPVERYMIEIFERAFDNQGQAICVQKYVDSIIARLGNVSFYGKTKSWPMKTVPLDRCTDGKN